MGDKQPPVQVLQDAESNVHNFIDKHLREIKWTAYGLGGIAIIVVFRSLRATQKFTHPSQIPDRFMQSSSTLQGIVRHVNDTGVLQIEHIPILELKAISKILKQNQISDQQDYLNVKPAGIVMAIDGIKWLQSNTVNKHAWFKMLKRDPDSLCCDIKIKTGRFFRSSICSEIIKQGFGKIEQFDTPPEGKAFNHYLVELIPIEQKASQKQRGLWKEHKEKPYILKSLSQKSYNVWSKSSSVWNKLRKFVKSKFSKNNS